MVAPVLTVLIISITLLVITASFFSIEGKVHKDMTLKHCFENGFKWNYGTFAQAVREYENREWKRNKEYPKSRFALDGQALNYIHAGRISFDGKGMVLNAWDYRKFEQYLGLGDARNVIEEYEKEKESIKVKSEAIRDLNLWKE